MSRVTAIVTVFNPVNKHKLNIKKIADQVDRIIVCDNSVNCNRILIEDIKNGYYSSVGQNLGLSKAFNKVLKDIEFGWNDDDYIIFFDQDSVVPELHISLLIDEFEFLQEKGYEVGCLGPFFYNTSSERLEIPKEKVRLNEHTASVYKVITSSMLSKYSMLEAIEFWNEEIFLDMADWDICWRLQQKGYLCCMTDKTILHHSLGEGQKKIGFFTLKVGKPFREYYETRDCLYLFKKDYAPLMYKLRFIAMLTIRPMLHLMFLDDKKERWYYIKRGVADYKKGVHGAL